MTAIFILFQEEKMRKTKKIFAVMLTLALMLVFIPTTAQAATDPGVVAVTVSNNTFEGADWTGELFTTFIDLEPGMTLGEAVKAACDQADVSVTGATVAEGSYIMDIDGLGFGDAGGYSGWMCSVNNWFNLNGLSDPAQDGDWISVQYSADGMGSDLGSFFPPDENANNKTLQQIVFDQGTLDPEFAPDIHSYTLTVPTGTEGLFVMPLAFNLNYQVRTSVEGTEYKLMEGVPAADGTVITIICGDPQWPSMNNSTGNDGSGAEAFPAETYTITIAYEDVVDDGDGDSDENGEPEVTSTEDDSPKTGDANMMIPLAMMAGLVGLAGAGAALAVKRRTN